MTGGGELSPADDAPAAPSGSAGEVFRAALGLGLTSFGGPIAHIGYFERAYVRERKWLAAEEFAALVALCQMAPGPASSQLGFLIGLRRAGWRGALAAWLGFTLPSAVLMFGFALLAPRLGGPWAEAALHGLKLVAVAVVAQAVWSMAKTMCPDLLRTGMAVAAGLALTALGGPQVQMLVLAAGAAGGMAWCRNIAPEVGALRLPVSPRVGVAAIAAFFVLLLGLPMLGGTGLIALAGIFYRAGALVFGGGHVVLPLLRDALVPGGWLGDGAFLAGYGAVQAVPGPLFAFAAYLGAAVAPPAGGPMGSALWAATATGALFLPGLLAAIAGVAAWNRLGHYVLARRALAGVNAVVVGILGAALYMPLWMAAIFRPVDAAIAAGGFVLLQRWRAPPIAVVAGVVGASLLLR